MIPAPAPDDFKVDLEAEYSVAEDGGSEIADELAAIRLAAHFRRLAALHVTQAVLDGAEPCEFCKGIGRRRGSGMVKCGDCNGTGAKQ